ncbi:MAG: integrase/recombinase XerD [Planctomycetota bacterium]|jgi:integrase/recombinase XerD
MATIKILLRNKPTTDGLFPIVLRITKDRKVKLISLGVKCFPNEWDESNQMLKKSHNKCIQTNRVLLKMKSKALEIINEFILNEDDFTLTQFEMKFRGKDLSKVTVLEFWNEKIEDLIKAGRVGNARAYKDTKTSFFKFQKNTKVMFKEITPEVLDKYETYMRSNGCTDGGIAVRMRELRALINDAIKKEVVQEKHYPFKVYKISKLKGKGIKKALLREEIRLIENFDTDMYPHLVDAKNYFLFSYYTRGMNFYDMMKLTWDNVQGDRIYYIRSKTKGRFTIKTLKPVKEILKYYKNQYRLTPFVFPILLREGLTPSQIENRKAKTLKKFNRQLKEIAKIQGLEKTISSYTARHSFATNLKHFGISTDVIGEAMGHSNVEITKAYLKEFGDDVLDDAMKNLLQEPSMLYA